MTRSTSGDGPPAPRASETDACPGALRLHEAADGLLARVRLPGGMLTPTQLAALATAANNYASPVLELTSRGNVQLRSIVDAEAVTALLNEAGLLPAPTHERVRNIVASPLSGRIGDYPDIRSMVGRLDQGLIARPSLATLPGKFLFGIDDGRGDMAALGADIGAMWDGNAWRLQLGGRHADAAFDVEDVVHSMLSAAEIFANIRDTAWRVTDLPGGPDQLAEAFGVILPPHEIFPPASGSPLTAHARLAKTQRAPVGWLEHTSAPNLVTLGAAIPLGELTSRVAAILAAADKPIIITPWRSVLLCDLTHDEADAVVRVLAPLGLIFDACSPWLDVSACTGLPGCARSRTDVRNDVRTLLAREISETSEPGVRPAVHRHWVGCDRGCGSPLAGEVLVAQVDGYRPR